MVGWLQQDCFLIRSISGGGVFSEEEEKGPTEAPHTFFTAGGTVSALQKPVSALAKQVWASGRECDESVKELQSVRLIRVLPSQPGSSGALLNPVQSAPYRKSHETSAISRKAEIRIRSPRISWPKPSASPW